MLIHCKAGADRAGLIAAAWKLRQQKETPQNAYKQLSIYYGHFPYLWSKTKVMDQSFWNYVTYLRAKKQKVTQNSKILPIPLQLAR
ncbi:MAG: hypothetical protein JRH08_16110 [Deltaproteobacteria bacterium]|nr:hypothetical protein [Deltaproteobacteria bacterium]